MKLNMNELSIIAIYAAPTLRETLERMEQAPVEKMEQSIQPDFLSALSTLKGMDETAYAGLDLQNVLVTDDEDEKEAEENAGA